MQSDISLPVELAERLKNHEQSHLIDAFEALSSSEDRQVLLDELNSLDFDLLASLHQKACAPPRPQEPEEVSAFSGTQSLESLSPEEKASYREKGFEVINRGELAVVIMAAGQGSRLGFEHPKGLYDIQLQSQESIFGIICKRLVKLHLLAREKDSAGKGVRLFIMTSPMNHEETRQYFLDQEYFGLSPEQVVFFPQGTLPALDLQGKVLMESPSRLFMAPNGNGGIYQALHDQDIIRTLREHKVQYTQIIGVDNVLVKIGDPLFVGYMAGRGFKAGAKYIDKARWDEKVGVHCVRKGLLEVVEYSEITPQQAQLKDSQGRLVYRAANIVNMMVHTSFLATLDSRALCLLSETTHVANKTIQAYHPDTKKTIPTPARKFEMFVFDVYALLEDSLKSFGCLEAKREEEFAPVKNQEGMGDSPDTARQLISRLHAKWLLQAGYTFLPQEGDHSSRLCEIAPLLTYEGEGLPQPEKGELSLPVYLQ